MTQVSMCSNGANKAPPTTLGNGWRIGACLPHLERCVMAQWRSLAILERLALHHPLHLFSVYLQGMANIRMMMNVNKADESATAPKFKRLSVPMHSFDVLEQGTDHGCNLDTVL